MKKKIKRTIKMTQWDNWYGYENGKKVIEFYNDINGSQEKNAKRWLSEKQA